MKTLKLRYQGTKKKHTLSLNDVNENLDDATVRAAMNEIKEAALIQKDNEVYYVKPLSANYTETIVTPIFDDTEVTVEEQGDLQELLRKLGTSLTVPRRT